MHLRELLPERVIQRRVLELGRAISRDTPSITREPLLVLGVLKGALPFLADLIRCMEVPLHLDFVRASSYRATSRGELTLEEVPEVRGRHVLVVDDIVDSGYTLKAICEALEQQGAASVRACTLLNKPGRREVEVPWLTYVGFEIEDVFVVGYGLDFLERFRELRFIACLEQVDPEAS